MTKEDFSVLKLLETGQGETIWTPTSARVRAQKSSYNMAYPDHQRHLNELLEVANNSGLPNESKGNWERNAVLESMSAGGKIPVFTAEMKTTQGMTINMKVSAVEGKIEFGKLDADQQKIMKLLCKSNNLPKALQELIEFVNEGDKNTVIVKLLPVGMDKNALMKGIMVILLKNGLNDRVEKMDLVNPMRQTDEVQFDGLLRPNARFVCRRVVDPKMPRWTKTMEREIDTVRDPNTTNGGLILVGHSGQGKSVAVKAMIREGSKAGTEHACGGRKPANVFLTEISPNARFPNHETINDVVIVSPGEGVVEMDKILEEFEKLLDSRAEGGPTYLVIDNFHEMRLLGQGWLNRIEAFLGKLESRGDGSRIYLLGERMDDELNKSLIQQHRFQRVNVGLTKDDMGYGSKNGEWDESAPAFVALWDGMRVGLDELGETVKKGMGEEGKLFNDRIFVDSLRDITLKLVKDFLSQDVVMQLCKEKKQMEWVSFSNLRVISEAVRVKLQSELAGGEYEWISAINNQGKVSLNGRKTKKSMDELTGKFVEKVMELKKGKGREEGGGKNERAKLLAEQARLQVRMEEIIQRLGELG